jgi:hypothetical protein
MKILAPARLGGLALLIGALLALSPISPGKDVSLALESAWTPGHLVDLASYMFLLLGLPAICGSVGDRLGPVGAIGYVAFVARLTLSVGSQLYEARVVPVLVRQSELAPLMTSQGNLQNIYGSAAIWLSIALSTGGVLFAMALWRAAPKLRWIAGLIGLGSALAAVIPPLGIVMFSVGFGWIGGRLLKSGDVATPLRARPPFSIGSPVQNA